MSDTVDPNQKHPDSSFSAEYPYNQATITRSGHEFHINDTPDNESLKVSHTKGTYVEVNKDGRWTQVVAEKGYEYYKDGLAQTVDGQYDIKIGGAHNLQIDNSSSEGITGDKYIGVGGSLVIGSAGARYDNCNDDRFDTIGGNKTSQVNGDDYESVVGDQVVNVNGTKTDVIGNDLAKTVGGNIEIVSGGVIRFVCKTFIIDADEIILNAAAGQVRITASDIIKLTGSEIHLND